MTALILSGFVLIVFSLGYVVYLKALPPSLDEKPKRKRKNDEEWRELEEMLPEYEEPDPNALAFDTSDWVARMWNPVVARPDVQLYGDYMAWVDPQNLSGLPLRSLVQWQKISGTGELYRPGPSGMSESIQALMGRIETIINE